METENGGKRRETTGPDIIKGPDASFLTNACMCVYSELKAVETVLFSISIIFCAISYNMMSFFCFCFS